MRRFQVTYLAGWGHAMSDNSLVSMRKTPVPRPCAEDSQPPASDVHLPVEGTHTRTPQAGGSPTTQSSKRDPAPKVESGHQCKPREPSGPSFQPGTSALRIFRPPRPKVCDLSHPTISGCYVKLPSCNAGRTRGREALPSNLPAKRPGSSLASRNDRHAALIFLSQRSPRAQRTP